MNLIWSVSFITEKTDVTKLDPTLFFYTTVQNGEQKSPLALLVCISAFDLMALVKGLITVHIRAPGFSIPYRATSSLVYSRRCGGETIQYRLLYYKPCCVGPECNSHTPGLL